MKNNIQFARLIAELEAVGGFTKKVLKALSAEMDLTEADVLEIIDQAQAEFDAVKQSLVPPANRLKPTFSLPTRTVVVEVAGGAVQNVFSNPPTSILVVDWDNIEGGDKPTWMASDNINDQLNDDVLKVVKDKIKDLDQDHRDHRDARKMDANG